MIPFNITFRDMDPSDAVRYDVQERLERIEKLHDKISSCDVIVSEPHRRHRQGKIFHVHIRFHVPGKEIVVSREPEQTGRHEDMRATIGDVFDEAERQLEDFIRKRRLWKTQRPGSRVEAPTGKVARIFYERDFGFITADDGREIYFHRNSVLDGKFDNLKPGDSVFFAEEKGNDGPQASTVKLH